MKNFYYDVNDLADCVYDYVSDSGAMRISDLEDRMCKIEASSYKFAEAMKQIQAGIKTLGANIGALMAEEAENLKQNEPGDFWDEIAKNNMFL